MNYSLQAITRTAEKVGTNLRADRAARSVPAVMYGNKVENKNLFVTAIDFDRIYKQAGESSLVDLSIDGGSAVKVLIHDVQFDPIKDIVSHIDFYQVNMNEEVKTNIPFHFVGVASAVKDMGGMLMHPIEHVSVECLPGDLIDGIDVDISVLTDFDKVITIADLKLPKTLKVLDHEELVIASVARPRTEEEMASLNKEVEVDISKVEKVETKKKDEEEVEEETKK